MSGILMMSVGNSYGSLPVNTVAPVVSGTATVGQTLSTTNGTWLGAPAPTFTYQWQRAGSNISGATSSTYVLVSADAGSTIRCVVTATNAVGIVSANSNSTASVTEIPANTVAPVVSGTASVGQTLTTTNGTWTGTPTPTFTYQWQRGASNISGATSSTYILQFGDASNTVRCVVTATNSQGAVSANSNSTGTVSLPSLGSAAAGGFYGGQISTTANGVATHYLIIGPLSSAQSTLQWKTTATSTAGTSSVIDGPTNSANMNNASHPAAQFCEGLSIGGFTDWYLPALNELEVLYYNFKPTTQLNNTNSGTNLNAVPSRGSNYTTGTPGQTGVAIFVTGGSEAFFADDHIASTEVNASNGWVQSFSSGRQNNGINKTAASKVRAIRRVAV